MARRDELEQQVRDALLHLHDVVYLQTHPLAQLATLESARASRREAGLALRERLLATIEALRPMASDGPLDLRRGYQVLVLRYIEGLGPSAAGIRLGVGKSQFYREHERALAAVTSLVAETWAASEPTNVASPAVPAVPPRSASIQLPSSSTSFVGREPELKVLVAALVGRPDGHGSRLLTLGGPPGVGKTRLALEGARMAAARGIFDEIQYVDLSVLELGAAGQVLPLIHQAVGLAPESGVNLLSDLARHFGGRNALLVLDNFEQVLDAADDLARLLERCSSTQALVTSRKSLGLYGERELAVLPLAAPPPDGTSIDRLSEYPAVELFLDRATAVDPAFTLTPSNQFAVGAICRRLDGLPLAIELAAARLKVLPPQALLERLEDRLALLTNGPRNVSTRHQTLRAAIDWSYQLLESDEQLVLRELAVFAGSFSLAAAEAVVTGAPRPLLDIVQSLIEHGLLLVESPGPRYRLLETIREYATERLAESGQRQVLRGRHMEYYVVAGERRFDRDTRLAIEDDDNLRDALQVVLHEALAAGRQQRDKRQIALALAGLASLDIARGDFNMARAHTLESGGLFTELEDADGLAALAVSVAEAGAAFARSSGRLEDGQRLAHMAAAVRSQARRLLSLEDLLREVLENLA